MPSVPSDSLTSERRVSVQRIISLARWKIRRYIHMRHRLCSSHFPSTCYMIQDASLRPHWCQSHIDTWFFMILKTPDPRRTGFYGPWSRSRNRLGWPSLLLDKSHLWWWSRSAFDVIHELNFTIMYAGLSLMFSIKAWQQPWIYRLQTHPLLWRGRK